MNYDTLFISVYEYIDFVYEWSRLLLVLSHQSQFTRFVLLDHGP